jgi:hypothetical protein
MPVHLFIVRSTVADPAQRAGLDAWYSKEHLPDAVKAFGIAKASRYWSESDPAVHVAMYQFPDRVSLDRAMTGDVMKQLVAEFDRCWPDVKRTREIMVLAEDFAGA